MSMYPEPPKRLAEILQEILALSNSRRASQSECACDDDPTEYSVPDDVNEQSHHTDE